MKSKIHILISLILSSIIFYACNTEQPATVNKSPKAMAISQKGEGGNLSHKIDSAHAVNYINDYKSYIDGVNQTILNADNPSYPDPSEKLVYGARVDLIELREILLHAKSGDQLYAMLAVMPTDSTEIIFTLESASTNKVEFFDFTYPCPTACPTYLNINYR
jgi:hypothetical protein